MRSLPDLMDFCRGLARWARLMRSNAFDAARYCEANPDLAGYGAARATLHFVRYGHAEQRTLDQTATGAWLVPYLLSGDVAAGPVRKLARALQNGADEPSAVSAFCAATGLSPAEFDYFTRMQEQKFALAYESLAQIPMPAAFLQYYRFARRHMKLDRLPDALNWVAGKLSAGRALRVPELIAARDIADALGYRGIDRLTFHRQLLAALARWRAPSRAQRFRVMWQMGFPLVQDGSPLAAEVMSLLPLELQARLEGPALPPPASVAGWEAALNLVTKNALQETQWALAAGGGADSARPLADVEAQACRVRVLGEGYWREADTQADKESFVSAFKAASLRAAREFPFLYPVAASNIFDVRQTAPCPVPTLSYHTISAWDQRFLNFKESALPGFFKFDREGFSGWESAAPLPQSRPDDGALAAAFETLREDFVGRRRSKYAQADTGESLPNGFILVALQVPDDTVMSLAAMDVDEWLPALVETYRGTGTHIVIKAHPHDRSEATRKRLARLKAMSGEVYETRAAIHTLLARSRALVTVNSGVGIEALMHLKPVIALGEAEYAQVAWPVRSVAEMIAALDGVLAETPGPDWRRRVQQYLYTYCFERSFGEHGFPAAFDDMIAGLKRGAQKPGIEARL